LNTDIAAKRAQLDTEAAELDSIFEKALDAAIEGKETDVDVEDLRRRVQANKEAKADLDRQEAAHKAAESDPKIAALKAYSGEATTQAPNPRPNRRPLGRDACPLAFKESDFKALHQAMATGQNIRIKSVGDVQTKAFSTAESLLPPSSGDSELRR
jgi:hypothetical protein